MEMTQIVKISMYVGDHPGGRESGEELRCSDEGRMSGANMLNEEGNMVPDLYQCKVEKEGKLITRP